MRNSGVTSNNQPSPTSSSMSSSVMVSPIGNTNNNNNAIASTSSTTAATASNANVEKNQPLPPSSTSPASNTTNNKILPAAAAAAVAVVLLRCIICRKPVEISNSVSSNSNQQMSSSSSSAVSAANVLYSCAVTTAQDFPLCQTCWQHRHITTQQTSLTELSSLVETLNSVENVNPTAIAVFQGASLEIDPCSHEYIALGVATQMKKRNAKKGNTIKRKYSPDEDKENRRLFQKNNDDDDDDEADDESDETAEGNNDAKHQEFMSEKEKLLLELAELEKKVVSKRGEILSLQEDLTVFSQQVDGIERKQNGLVNQESAVRSAAQAAASRLQKAKSGFARLGLSTAEGIASILEQQNQISPTTTTNTNNNNNIKNNVTNTSNGTTTTTTTTTSSSSSSEKTLPLSPPLQPNFLISSIGSCLSAAYQLDVDDTIPRINGRRVGRLPQSLSVPDEEINCGCGFLSLLMQHFLQSYTKMERTGCSMEPLGSQSTITVFVPKKITVDFHIKRKLFSWSTFGQAWVVFANCTNEVVTSMTAGLRVKAQKLRSNAGFIPGSPAALLVNRIDDHVTTSQSSLPKITAAAGNPVAKVDDNNAKYGDASDTMWTAAVHGLFRCLKWCIEAEKYLAE